MPKEKIPKDLGTRLYLVAHHVVVPYMRYSSGRVAALDGNG